MIIAVAGKGGVGKSTIASLLVRYLVKQKKSSVLAVDADPNSNLGDFLGVQHSQDIGALVDDISKNPDQVPPDMGKDGYIEYRIQTSLAEADGFDLLVMGRPEGPGCYCYPNNVLKRVISNLLTDYSYVVIDNEAGFEHLSRRTTPVIDAFVIISDPTPIGLKAARRILQLVSSLGIRYKKKFLIMNALQGKKNPQPSVDFDIEIAGMVGQHPSITDRILSGGLLKLEDSEPVVQEIEKIFSKIIT